MMLNIFGTILVESVLETGLQILFHFWLQLILGKVSG